MNQEQTNKLDLRKKTDKQIFDIYIKQSRNHVIKKQIWEQTKKYDLALALYQKLKTIYDIQ